MHVWYVQSKRKVFIYLDKAKLPQGLHNPKWMRPMDDSGQQQSHASGMCTLPALLSMAPQEHPVAGEKQEVESMEQGKTNWSGGGEGKSPAPERDSACTRLGVGSSAGDSTGGRSGSVPVTQPGCPGNLSGLSGPTHAAPRSQAAPPARSRSRPSSSAQPRVTPSSPADTCWPNFFATIPKLDPG